MLRTFLSKLYLQVSCGVCLNWNQLEEILMSLLNNANKFTQNGFITLKILRETHI